MAVWCILKEVVVFLFVLGISDASTDLLETLNLSPSNPAELNDFLRNVLAHKDDFNWIRHASKKAENPNRMDNKHQQTDNQFNRLTIPYDFKRNIKNNRPVNDVYPYMFESLNEPNRGMGTFTRNSRNQRRKRKRRRGKRRQPRSRGSVSLDLNNEQEPGEVNVVPRSELGVLNVPGNKYSTRRAKSCQEDSDSHDMNSVEKAEASKNKTQNGSKTDAQSEYYYAAPHDVLGLAQDITKENEDKNKTCVHTRNVIPSNISKPGPVTTTVVKKLSPAPVVPIKSNNYGIPAQFQAQQPTQLQPQQVPMSIQSPVRQLPYQPIAQQFPNMMNDFRQNQSFSAYAMPTANPNEDIMRLLAYVETPNRESPVISKQDLLKSDNDNVLQNIDKILKSDRTGLKIYNDQPNLPIMRKSTNEDEVDETYKFHSPTQPQTLNTFPVNGVMPIKRRDNLLRLNSTAKVARSITSDLNDNSDEGKTDLNRNVELDFNARPRNKYNGVKKMSGKRKSKENSVSKKILPYKSIDLNDINHYLDMVPHHMHQYNLPLKKHGDNYMKEHVQNVLSEQRKFLDDTVKNFGHSNVKLEGCGENVGESKGDDIPEDLKVTMKEYENRQNDYKAGKNQYEEEEDITPDYSLVQQKKNLLEDQTEPTSAAEQRELGRKDNEFVTQSMNETDGDTLIVIPLKKDILSDTVSSLQGGDFEKQQGFKVKESKDVIHGKGNHNLNMESFDLKDKMDDNEFHHQLSPDYIEKFKSKEKHSTNDQEKDEDYNDDASSKVDDKLEKELDPSNVANFDYDYYENFDQKRDVQSTLGTLEKFQSRKLKAVDHAPYIKQTDTAEKLNAYGNLDYSNGQINDGDRLRTKRNSQEMFDFPDNSESLSDSYNNFENSLRKRSENEESDEEPGNDSKTAEYKPKKTKDYMTTQKIIKADNGITMTMTAYTVKPTNSQTNDYPPDDENESKPTPRDACDVNDTTIVTNESSTEESINPESKTGAVSYNYYNVTINILNTSGEEATTEIFENVTSNKSERKSGEFGTTKYQGKADKMKTAPYSADTQPSGDDRKSYDIFNKIHRGFLPKNAIIGEITTNGIDSAESEEETETNSIQDSVTRDEQSITTDESVDLPDEAQFNDDQNKNSKEELLANKLKEMIGLYKKQLKLIESGEVESDDAVSQSVVHHKPNTKRTQTLPQDVCVTPHPDSYVHEKHTLAHSGSQTVQPLRESYYDVESMADDLKEQMLIQKIYDNVVNKRKSKLREQERQRLKSDEEEEFSDDDSIETYTVDLDAEIEDMDKQKRKENGDDNFDDSVNEQESDNSYYRLRKRKKSAQQQHAKLNKFIRNSDDLNENLSGKLTARETNEANKIKLDNIDSFKDIIEQTGLKNRKRRSNLKDYPDSYLSPINENSGKENRRFRRRLRYLGKNRKHVRAIVEATSPNTNADSSQPEYSMSNFQKTQNFNVDNETTKLETTIKGEMIRTTPMAASIHSSHIPPVAGVKPEKNCSEVDAAKFNHSKLEECLEKKKENEDMKKMLCGNFAINIIEIFFAKLKDNSVLYNRFGSSIGNSKQCAAESVEEVRKFREEQAKLDIKHAEEMLHEVILMLNRIVADQVHRRTCLQLSPNMKLFVIRITKNLRNLKKNNQIAEGFPLPKMKSRNDDSLTPSPDEEQGEFLFDSPETIERYGGKNNARSDIQKKIKLVEKLLEKYQRMSSHCQVQVEPVKDYLLKHLGMLMKLLEKAASDSSTCKTTTKISDPDVCNEDIEPPHNNNNNNNAANCNVNSAECCLEQEETTPAHVGMGPHSQPPMQQMIPQIIPQQPMMLPQQQNPTISQPRLSKSYVSAKHVRQESQNASVIPPDNSSNQSNDTDGSKSQPAQQNAHTEDPATTAIVNSQLQSDGKFTNPELVSKDLLNMGLGGGNNYLPPFDLHGIVEERVLKTKIGENAANPSAGNTNTGNTNAGGVPAGGGGVKPAYNFQPMPLYSRRQSDRYKRLSMENGNHADNDDLNRKLYEEVLSLDDRVDSIKSKNKELQDFLAAPIDIHPNLFNSSCFCSSEIIRRLVPGCDISNYSKCTNYATYGKDQFLEQPLLVNATAIPDPSVEDTEMYTGAKYENPEVVNNDLANIGLDGENSYIIPLQVDTVVQTQEKADASKSDAHFPILKPATLPQKKKRALVNHRKTLWNVSDKYKKLAEAAAVMREKRQNEERIGELYGSKLLPIEKLSNVNTMNKEMQDISKISFEKPVVFSLDT